MSASSVIDVLFSTPAPAAYGFATQMTTAPDGRVSMAKYNAIYEGRLPHGIYNKIIGEATVIGRQGLTASLIDTITKVYKKYVAISRY